MRKINKGIFFYPMEVDHTANKRLRLLFNDHDSDGYWIWSNLISYGYKQHGYYFAANEEDIELLSADCRKSPELINDVIHSCVKRGLFVKEIYEQQNVLTNDRMQINYLRATYETRRKGSIIYFSEKYYAINQEDLKDFTDKFLINVLFKESGKYLQKVFSEAPPKTELFKNSTEDSHTSTEDSHTSTEKGLNSEHKGKERKGKENVIPSDDGSVEFIPGIVGIKKSENNSMSGVTKIGAGNRKKVAPKKEKSLETKIFNDIKIIWWEWYRNRNQGTSPKFDGSHGIAIQKLTSFFISTAKGLKKTTEEEIFISAKNQIKYILEHWEDLKGNKFLYGCVDIRKINSNINDIINHLKNGIKSHQQVPSSNGGRTTKSSGAEAIAGLLKDEITTHAARTKSS